jgi:hypothetical protein
MKQFARTLCFAILAMVLGAGSSGSSRADTKYYFSAAGGDANSCATPQSACQTIGKLNSMSYAAGDSILLRGGERFVGCAMLNTVNVPSRGSAARPITVDSYGSGKAILLSDCPGQRALVTIDGVSGIAIRNLVLSANGKQTAMGILIQNSGKQTVVDGITVQNNEIIGFNINGSANYAAEVFVTDMTISGQCGALNDIRIIDNRLHGASVLGPMKSSPPCIVTPPSSRCPWSTLRPPHCAVRGSGEPI